MGKSTINRFQITPRHVPGNTTCFFECKRYERSFICHETDTESDEMFQIWFLNNMLELPRSNFLVITRNIFSYPHFSYINTAAVAPHSISAI
jgi:hypothetical protein